MSGLDDMFGAATVIPDAIDLLRAAELRANLHYARYRLLDRGSYEYADARLDDVAIALAARVTGRALRVIESRVLRLRAGDYVLARHDRFHDGVPVEVVVDLSPASVPGAELHYRRRGQVFFRFACAPGSAAIVERGPTVTSNHTYVSKRDAAADVVRLVALLR